MTTTAERLRHVETTLADLTITVGTIRRELQGDEVSVATPAASPARPPATISVPTAPTDAQGSRPARAPSMPPLAPAATTDRPARDPIDFFGPRALAWYGGVAMLLGIVFFFVLAVRRGWVDEELRVALGTAVSFVVLGVSNWLHRRLPDTPAALTTAAVGIGGLLVTLFAATRLYGFVSEPVGIALAVAVGAGAVAMGVRWRAEILGALGLVGSILGSQLIDVTPSATGVTMVAAAFAAASVVAIRLQWVGTGVAAVLAIIPQTAWLIETAATDVGIPWAALLSVSLVAGISLALATRWQETHGDEHGVELVGAVAVAGALGIGSAAALMLLTTDPARAAGLATLAVGFLVAGWALRAQRDGSALMNLVAVALTTGSVVLVLDGLWRVVALSTLAVVVGVFANRLSDDRVFAGAAGVLAIGNAFAFAVAPPIGFFEQDLLSGSGALGLFAVAAAAVGLTVIRGADQWRRIGTWTSLISGLLALSVGLLTTVVALSDSGNADAAFQRGHMIVSFVWALIGLGALWFGMSRSHEVLRRGGPALLVAALAKIFLFDLANLEAMTRALSFLVVGSVLVAGAVLVARVRADEPEVTAVEPTST